MKGIKVLLAIVLLSSLMIWSCKKDEVVVDPGLEITSPKIVSLNATMDTINFGGTEPTVITCTAEGGGLTYLWEVDLGDIIPQNEAASVINFTGSACCIGDKVIKCTVSNQKGSVEQTIKIYIREP
ncbi:MAG: hypothetical protein JEZ03_05990 [Bacteroidales bacterium]|nr:hypothetical protein [Bacteroidales bacterium]